MFKASLENVSLLRNSLEAVSELIDEAELEFNQDGVQLLASDRAVVAVANLEISKKVFKKYQIKKKSKLGLNLPNFMDILKRAGDKDKLEMELKDNRLHISMVNGSTRNFVVPLIDVSSDEAPSIDKLDFPAELKLKTDVLTDSISDAELFADSLVFNVKDDEVVMNTESDNRVAEMKLDKKSDGLIKLKSDKKVRSRYSLDYLKKIIKAKKLTDKVTLNLSSDYPMKMTFEVPKKVTLNFILAPRVEE